MSGEGAPVNPEVVAPTVTAMPVETPPVQVPDPVVIHLPLSWQRLKSRVRRRR